jgi:hypothetical protein
MPMQVCSCSEGLDVCQMLGQCSSDTCPLYQDLIMLNNERKSCISNANCSTDGTFVCENSPYKTFTCSNSVLSSVQHSGYCVEAAPSLASSVLSDSADVVVVSLKGMHGRVIIIAGIVRFLRSAVVTVDEQPQHCKAICS